MAIKLAKELPKGWKRTAITKKPEVIVRTYMLECLKRVGEIPDVREIQDLLDEQFDKGTMDAKCIIKKVLEA